MTTGTKYVERVREIVVESYILHECWNGNVSREQLEKNFRAVPLQDFQAPKFEQVLERVEREGHVKREGNNYRTTDDGKEDLQKVEPWFTHISQQFGHPRGGTKSAPMTGTPTGPSGQTGTMGGRGTTQGTHTSPGFPQGQSGSQGTPGTRKP